MRVVKMKNDGSGRAASILIGVSTVTVVATPDPYLVTVDLQGLTEQGDPLLLRVVMTRNELSHINRCVAGS